MWPSRRTSTLEKAIRAALSKPAPDRFTIDPSNDFFIATLRGAHEGADVLVESLTGEIVSGKAWNGERFELPVKIDLSKTRPNDLFVEHYFSLVTIRTEGAAEFIRSRRTLAALRAHFKEGWLQWRYERTTNFRHDRIDLLRRLLELRILRATEGDHNPTADKGLPDIHWFSEMYGARAYLSPQYKRERAQFELIFGSLVASGDLAATSDYCFQVQAKAVKTIADFELEERRHSDSQRLSFWLVILTLVLALAAIFDLAVTFNASRVGSAAPVEQSR